ncbi:hypothetical protein PIB30_023839 [Stylosanthes scabra]|uniref:GRF-type domain-containing protein n=1 Tax=Stylosanthes scabra TaxID=79078 RepID=A0ABU6QAJ7_9FABA|nr:hypothetical protein [Stylosanthes scabra]
MGSGFGTNQSTQGKGYEDEDFGLRWRIGNHRVNMSRRKVHFEVVSPSIKSLTGDSDEEEEKDEEKKEEKRSFCRRSFLFARRETSRRWRPSLLPLRSTRDASIVSAVVESVLGDASIMPPSFDFDSPELRHALRHCRKVNLGIRGILTDQDMSYRGKRNPQDSVGSGNSSSSGDRFCDCGLKAPLQVSRSAANPGREYYTCPAGRCRWFKWAGPPLKCSVRRGYQSVELDAEDSKANSGNNFGLIKRSLSSPQSELLHDLQTQAAQVSHPSSHHYSSRRWH